MWVARRAPATSCTATGRSTGPRSDLAAASGGLCVPPRPAPSGRACSSAGLLTAGERPDAGEVERPAVLDVDAVFQGLPTSAVPLGVPVHQGDAGGLLALGGERDLDLAGPDVQVGERPERLV